MNRVIKFRQFSMGKMFYWGFGSANDESHFTGPASGSGVLPHKSPQMQFTGLHDVNGFEVYEGDIVELIDGEGVSVVEQKNGCWVFESCEILFQYANQLRVIGNIYQNPELFHQE